VTGVGSVVDHQKSRLWSHKRTRVARVQRGVATKDRSRCIDFAYDPELRERQLGRIWVGLYMCDPSRVPTDGYCGMQRETRAT
jgi:hypothetical protein